MVSQTRADACLKMSEAVAYTGLHDKTLRRYISAGRLPAYRIGARTILIKRSDLDALICPIPATGGHR